MAIVPDVPGVPPLFRSGIAPVVALLTGDTVTGFGTNLRPVWGIYKNGQPIIPADTARTFSFRREWAVADYQVEQGGFESFDKVDLPFEPRIDLMCGGPIENRQAFLAAIDAVAKTLTLFDVVTPETVYTSVNIQHYDYNRAASRQLGLMVVSIWLLEIRVIGTSGQNVKDPSGATQTNGGQISPTTPTDQEATTPPTVQ